MLLASKVLNAIAANRISMVPNATTVSRKGRRGRGGGGEEEKGRRGGGRGEGRRTKRLILS